MPDDSMGPTDDLLARLRACLARAKRTEPNATLQGTLEYHLAEAADRIYTLKRELEEARKEHYKDFVLLNVTAATVMSLTQRERDASQALAASRVGVERLTAALEWYADHSNYKWRLDSDGRRYPPKALLDDGDRARIAITTHRGANNG